MPSSTIDTIKNIADLEFHLDQIPDTKENVDKARVSNYVVRLYALVEAYRQVHHALSEDETENKKLKDIFEILNDRMWSYCKMTADRVLYRLPALEAASSVPDPARFKTPFYHYLKAKDPSADEGKFYVTGCPWHF